MQPGDGNRAPTISDRLAATDNRPSGFDYLRILLALSVAVWHIPQLTYGAAGMAAEFHSPAWAISRPILPSFFSLSGFLVAGSFERCRTLAAFIGLRMIRIFPALVVEVTLSALIMGPLLSSLPLRTYFADPEFRRYFLNLVGEIHFLLPGVFTAAPNGDKVNAQLWTIPYELICYLLLTLSAVIGLRRRRIIAPVVASATMAAFFLRTGIAHHWQPSSFNASGIGPTHGLYLVWSFLWGVTFYLYRDRVRLGWPSIAVAAALALASITLEGMSTIVLPIVIAYLTAAVGLTDPPRAWFLRGADYSYGVYLYHWVIFQCVVSLVPHAWYWTAGLGLPLVVLFAAFSWHVVEKPAMRLRSPLMAGDRSTGGSGALLASIAVAAAMLGFLLSYQLYPLLNPTGAPPPVVAGPPTLE